MKFALICTLAADAEGLRQRLRGDHLRYIRTHKDEIVFGGPTVSAAGVPERMLIVLELPDAQAAQAFVSAEPYSAHGVFETVEVRAWAQVLPEAKTGWLDQQIAAQDLRERGP